MTSYSPKILGHSEKVVNGEIGKILRPQILEIVILANYILNLSEPTPPQVTGMSTPLMRSVV